MFFKGFITLPQQAILAIVIMGKVRCFLKDLSSYHSQPSFLAIVIMGKVRCFVKDLSPLPVLLYSFLYRGKWSLHTETYTNNSYNPSLRESFHASLVRGTFWGVYVSLTWTNGAPDV